MARLTLSEQVNAQATQISTLQAQLVAAESMVSRQADKIVELNERLEATAALRGQLAAANTRIEELGKNATSADNLKTMYQNNASKAESELEQAHAVLDGVDGAPSREYEGSYGKLNRNVVTRLAGAFLVIARSGGVK